jgi:hypothetical protein
MKRRKGAMGTAVLFSLAALLCCGKDSVNNGGRSSSLPVPGQALPGGSGNAPLGLVAQLNGRYAKSVRIEEDTWKATGPQQEISLSFAAEGMEKVKQFEFVLSFDPVTALDLDASTFVPPRPFLTFGSGIELLPEGQLRLGGAILQADAYAPAAGGLGTLTLKTGTLFQARTQVRVQVTFFSIGPSFQDRDDYRAEDLNMGLVLNE